MLAHVYVIKEIEQDNWFEGCSGPRFFKYDEKFLVSFNDTKDLIEKFAEFITNRFDIDHDDFMKHVRNEIEHDRFIYSQTENANARKIDLTEENPDGYCADYEFFIDKVTQEIDYKFDKVNN